MGHRITWDNEDQTVVLQEYTPDASKDDLYFLAQKSSKMLGTVEHIVHLIIDERNINLTLTSADMAYLGKTTPKNQGAVVMVVPEAKLRYKQVVQTLGKGIAPNAFAQPYFAGSIEEARQFLQEAFNARYSSANVE